MGKDILEKKIEDLMKEWVKYCRSKWSDAVFVKDGPFPIYEQQKKKILFIGRELYGKINKGEEGSCIDYRDERFGMNGLGVFQSRLLYLAYGILHGKYTLDDWLEMPEAKKLNQKFAEVAQEIEGTISYAFMNASKILNTQGTKVGEDFRCFINDKINRAFFIREIDLLAPDIIVSGNLNQFSFFDNDEFKGIASHCEEGKYDNDNCYVWQYKLQNGKVVPCLDAWHFSRIGADFEYFYEPICQVAKNLIDKTCGH